jgi:hypothetical protein
VTIWPDIPYSGPPLGYNATSYPKRYIAIHNTSNDASAFGEASYAKRRPDKVSSHYYVDSVSLVQSLDTRLGANHAGSSTGNRHAVSYEITGVNSWSRSAWIGNVAWKLLWRQCARDCKQFGIPADWLSNSQMRAGTPGGFVTHLQMSQVWGGSDHTDPGPNFPMDYLLAGVRAELDPTPERIFDMGMMMIAKDSTTGQHWLCDGMTRRKIAADDVGHYKYLASLGALSVWTGTPKEAPDSIWPNVSDLLGLPVVSGGSDAAAINVIVRQALNDTTLTVS